MESEVDVGEIQAVFWGGVNAPNRHFAAWVARFVAAGVGQMRGEGEKNFRFLIFDFRFQIWRRGGGLRAGSFAAHWRADGDVGGPEGGLRHLLRRRLRRLGVLQLAVALGFAACCESVRRKVSNPCQQAGCSKRQQAAAVQGGIFDLRSTIHDLFSSGTSTECRVGTVDRISTLLGAPIRTVFEGNDVGASGRLCLPPDTSS